MPLTGNVSADISELTHHGSRPRSHRQIVAIALHEHAKHMHDKTNYNDDHHADAHIANAHPHQSHSERHHALERTEVNPGRKAWNAGSRSITDETPIGQYKHHIHPRRDQDAAHFNVPEHPHHRE